MLTKIFAPLITSFPALKRTVWKGWYEFLAGGYKMNDWTFMNYGFAPPETENRAVTLDAGDEPDRCSIQLYHRVIGDRDLTGLNVLEVGSGRGGGSHYVARYHRPKSMTGVDFSDKAVAFSQKLPALPHLSFRQGDAENLPFDAGTFDVVINVESSHCYGSMERFLSEVNRVLKPGGYFLWADMQGKNGRDAMCAQFEKAGLETREEENMTPHVVRALDRINDRKRETIGRHVPKFLRSYFEDFAGVQGTRVYESLKAGNVEYWRRAHQKPMSS